LFLSLSGLASSSSKRLEIGQQDLEHIQREMGKHAQWGRENYTVITDAITEMEWWASFRKGGQASTKPKQGNQAAASADATSPPPKVHKKPWRNAPCACGSGLKYKKCCGKR